MFNLAALKYRRALAESGGPIARIASTPVSIYGHNIYQADAFLTPGLSPRKPSVEKSSEADGSGSSASPQTARDLAVSEAIARWAFHTERAGPNGRRYGMDESGSIKGTVAFPGLFKGQAQKRAQLEALELLAVTAWWSGHLKATRSSTLVPGFEVLQLQHPATFGEVVIIYRKAKSGHVSYGYAASESVTGAIARATIELARNEFTVTCHKICGRAKPIANYLERRCLYFATPAGHQEFIDRVNSDPQKSKATWDPLYDGELTGPWSRYATVWRTALRLPTQDHLDPDLNFFYW